MSDDNKEEIKQAYQDLDDTIRKIVTLEMTGGKGLVTDFVVAVAIQAYDDDGNMMDTVEPILPDGGRLTPRYRTLGLLKDLTVQYDAVAGAVTIESLKHNHDDEED